MEGRTDDSMTCDDFVVSHFLTYWIGRMDAWFWSLDEFFVVQLACSSVRIKSPEDTGGVASFVV